MSTPTLRPYQQRAIDELYMYWTTHQGSLPIVCMPTGSGKSIVIAELARLFFDTWPEHHPRTVVLVPSKELAEQNAEKLRALLPAHLSVGYYSASLGEKRQDADVIVATIGSIYKDAHLLGNIKMVIIDECHGVSTEGIESGRYRQFLSRLSRINEFCTVGFTATPFKGSGVWLTDGESPLFTGVACSIKIQELLDAGFLSPLVRPIDVIATRIDTTDVRTTGGDFNLKDLDDKVTQYLPAVVEDACTLAADRKKWIAFTPSVASAQYMVNLLRDKGLSAALVCGETPKQDRQELIADFKAGRLRCLVTVLALAIGFDVPDVDCIIWCRPTKSPVLYVQGAGRGMRIANGKTDCLWLDFSDTTERMGPVDTIKGRKKRASSDDDKAAPTKVCPECGERAPISARECPTCGAEFVMDVVQEQRKASNAAIMASQLAAKVTTYDITQVSYAKHKKEGKADSMRVDYYAGLRRVAQEWICFEHGGFAGEKARLWWARRSDIPSPKTNDAIDICNVAKIKEPTQITVDARGEFAQVVSYKWEVPGHA